MKERLALLKLRQLAALIGALTLAAAFASRPFAKGVEPQFELTDPAGAPFPSDRFTTPDASQLTGVHVKLPKPDCTVRSSDCNDIDILNSLDGFNLQPRLSIPFTGSIDLTTVSSASIFLFKLGPQPRFVGINQVVWDPETTTLYAESDELLDQHERYLLVVTDGVRDTAGSAIDSATFRKVLNHGQTSDPAERLIAQRCSPASTSSRLPECRQAGWPLPASSRPRAQRRRWRRSATSCTRPLQRRLTSRWEQMASEPSSRSLTSPVSSGGARTRSRPASPTSRCRLPRFGLFRARLAQSRSADTARPSTRRLTESSRLWQR